MATHIGKALQQAGYEVIFLCRQQDEKGGYIDAADLLERAKKIAPQRIICVQLEEAPTLRALNVPMAVDLFAEITDICFAGCRFL